MQRIEQLRNTWGTFFCFHASPNSFVTSVIFISTHLLSANNKHLMTILFPREPQCSPRGTLRVSGKQNSLFPVEPAIKCFVMPPNSKIEQIIYVCHLCLNLESFVAFVQILLFAKVSQRFRGIVGGLVSRFRVFVPKKLLNFFSSCLKVFSGTCKSKVQVVVTLGR